MNVSMPVKNLNRVGETLAGRLQRLGIVTVRDLLWYFPFRYEDYSRVVPIAALTEGAQVTVRARIEVIAAKRSPRKRTLLTEAVVADETGRLRLIWFGQPFIAKVLQAGDEVFFSGRVTSDLLGLQLVNPNYEKVKAETAHTARLVPMYPLTAGVTHKQLRFLMSQVIGLADTEPEWLPEEILAQADLPPLGGALRGIHFPENEAELQQSIARLKFDELYILQLRAEMIRQELARLVGPALPFVAEPIKEFVASLPFELTHDQKAAAWEIFQDMEKAEPMNRLLEGDVGSGKTVVAALAMYQAGLAGFQSALMAPTEILATQHFETVSGLFAKANVPIALLTSNKIVLNQESRIKNHGRDEVVKMIAAGKIPVVIGTHALLTEDVRFKNLGLVVVDEQHRFGVEQRRLMSDKSAGELTPHFLSMTATPIPRSYALTLYGDLDVSIIKQMPAGRKEIKTRVVAPNVRERAYQFIREQIRMGRQAFVICPLIEEKSDIRNQKSEIGGEKKSVLKEYEHLSKEIFPELNLSFLHGKMKPKEKDAAMQKFAAGEVDILVATSVVEVGVNIPNASVMMIEGADRFGLAQLHQFRGRVGRSVHQSYCFLFTDSDSTKVAERLVLFEKTSDGFALAEYDLATRGPGEVYGTAQSGQMHLRLATMRDVAIIKKARELARGIDFARWPQLKEKVRGWENTVHLE